MFFNFLVKLTLRSEQHNAHNKRAFLGHYECIKRVWYVHQGINWSSFEHIMSIFTHLVSCLCSKFALKMPTFGHHRISWKFPVFFTILSWCTHTALTSEASQGIICASFNHFHAINAPFMNCCCSDGALMATLHNFTFFLVFFFFNLVPSFYLLRQAIFHTQKQSYCAQTFCRLKCCYTLKFKLWLSAPTNK